MSNAEAMKVWLITGCSSGFGRSLAERVLAHGHSLLATARHPEQLQQLQDDYGDLCATQALDVTDPKQAEAAVATAVQRFGRLDVLVNNAGYGLVGALEEYSEEQIRRNLETNLIGPMHLMRAALPVMRQQKSGHIVNMSAIAGFANEMGFSIYGGAKFALEGMSEAVASEAGPFGIKVTIVEPGPFRTDFIGRSLDRSENKVPEYARTSGKFLAFLEKIDGQQPGDPIKAAEAILQAVAADKPPLRLALGKYAYDRFRKKLQSMGSELDAWESVALPTDF